MGVYAFVYVGAAGGADDRPGVPGGVCRYGWKITPLFYTFSDFPGGRRFRHGGKSPPPKPPQSTLAGKSPQTAQAKN